MIGRTLLHYTFIAKLGQGGMGAVYRAHDSRLQRDVAIKVLLESVARDERERARFQIEAQATAALSHPNIATIHAIESVGDELLIVMEYLEGSTLRDLIPQLDVDRALRLATQIADGLCAAHGRGIVHRDIKPSNIMVCAGDQVKILDFGLAKIGAGQELTRTGTTLGTVAYMSPEQVRGESLDTSSDIWSFGVVLYEMLCGQRPFAGEYERQIFNAICNDNPKPMTGVPPALARIVIRALEKPREARYASMADLIAHLRALTSRRQVSSQQDDAEPRREKRAGLAVLPFSSIRPDPGSDYLGFALADQIIGSLSSVPGVQVRSASAIRKYQNQLVDAIKVGLDLEVEFVLSGYYLKDASVIQLTIELIDLASNDMVWRESFRTSFEDVFALQDLAAEKVLRGLKVRFSEDDRNRMRKDAPADPLAYEYYLRAVSYPMTIEDHRLAIEMLERSIALDPNFPPAYEELGFRKLQRSAYSLLQSDAEQEAEAHFLKALSLNPNLTSTLAQLAYRYIHQGKHGDALAIIERIFKTKPDDASGHFALGYLYRYVGMLDDSIALCTRALELDPKNPRFRGAGFAFFFNRDYQRAYEAFGVDRDGTMPIAWRGMCLYYLGDREHSFELLDEAIAKEPEGFLGLRFGGIRAYLQGDLAASVRSLQRLEGLNVRSSDPEHWYLIASAYGFVRALVPCVQNLKMAVDRGYFAYETLLRDPQLDPVRSDPGFQEVVVAAKGKSDDFRKSLTSSLTAQFTRKHPQI